MTNFRKAKRKKGRRMEEANTGNQETREEKKCLEVKRNNIIN
jgi:hypothetical protein